MATFQVKRVSGGYILSEQGNEDCNIIRVVKVGEEQKIPSEILGFIFDCYLRGYGDSCIIEITTIGQDRNDEEDYVNGELFRDEVGFNYELLHKKGGAS